MGRCAYLSSTEAFASRNRKELACSCGVNGPALVAKSLCRAQEKRTMRESEAQIRNPESLDTV